MRGLAAAALACSLATGATGCGARAESDPCRAAIARQEWKDAVQRCKATGDDDRAALARAWLALREGHYQEVLELTDGLGRSEVATDAAYVAAHAHAERGEGEDDARAQARFAEALTGYRRAGRHGEASRTADYLARIASTEGRLDDALAMAVLSVEEAARSGDRRMEGKAETSLAEIHDAIGLVEDARDGFLRAEDLLVPWPADLAFTYLNHGLFLLDLDGDAEPARATLFLDEASAQLARLTDEARAANAKVTLAIALNRALVLGLTGDAARAHALLDELKPPTAFGQRRLELVRGFLAARAGELEAAEARFAAAELDDELDFDYRLRVSSELARLHHQRGELVEAERYYRDAIATAEALRQATRAPELRPHVLARRAAPYLGLVEVLAAQDRGIDALVVAEALHARSWLDDLLRRDDAVSSPAEALRLLRIRRESVAAEPLERSALLAAIGDREALVYVATGSTLLRAHVRAGDVSVSALTAADQLAIRAFADDPDDAAAAARAGTALLPAELEASARPLHLVVAGRLSALPFAALRHRGQRLIELRPLARLPGLAALGCRARSWSARRVFVGDAAGDLPAASAEVRRLGGSAALVGRDATLAALDDARDAALLHVAVHGRVTPSGGSLELADGALSAAAVLERRLAPREVVLTGCSTSASADAEDWAGLPSAFLANGSRHVIATLRSVDDADAAALARAYHEAPAGAGPVERLATAQRALAGQQPATSWAMFAVWGDPACGDREPE